MEHLFKFEIKKINQSIINLQIEFKELVIEYIGFDIKVTIKSLESFYYQSIFIDLTLLNILDSISLYGRLYWKNYNFRLINCINRSYYTMNLFLLKMRELLSDAKKGLICESNICDLALQWHRVVQSLKNTLYTLELQPVRRKGLAFNYCYVNV
jgi:hypothetical protein